MLFRQHYPPLLQGEATQLRDDILAIPRTGAEILNHLPVGVENDDLVDMHDLALQQPRRAVALLKKRVKDYPDCRQYWNYLYNSYRGSGQKRKAIVTLKEMMRRHPDYLFGRIALAENALDEDRLEHAITHLGAELDIRSISPQCELFHVSELFHYYLMVGCVLARRGDVQLAMGVREAVEIIHPSHEASSILEHEIMRALVENLSKKFSQRQERKIFVKIAPLSSPPLAVRAPVFHHEAVHRLYDSSLCLHDQEIAEILSLPRHTLVDDLTAVIRDCGLRGYRFVKKAGKNGCQNAAFHAFHFLAELRASCEVQDILAFFSLHPDVLDVCYFEEWSCHSQIASLIDHDVPACFAWLRTPGISSKGKSIIIEVIEHIAKEQDKHREIIVSEFGALLAFLLQCPREDNILDSDLVSFVIMSITGLRASEYLPLIHKASEMNLFDDFLCGSLKTIEKSMRDPMKPASSHLGIYEQYESYWAMNDDGHEEDDEENDENFHQSPSLSIPFPSSTNPNSKYANLFSPPMVAKPSFALPESRNAPCPCGSGMKYKKCCSPS